MLELLTQGRTNAMSGEVVVLNTFDVSNNTTQSASSDVSLSETQAVDWVVPSYVGYISAVAIGAGGSGDGSNNTNAGSGGGAGALAYITNYVVTKGDILRIYVGCKGRNVNNGGSGKRGNGASGIRHNGKAILLAGSGGGGISQTTTGSGGIALIGDVRFNGGKGAAGGGNVGGDGGSVSNYYSTGLDGAATDRLGGAGSTPYGLGNGTYMGTPRDPSPGANGGIGVNYGGGGGGANDETAGGTSYSGGNGGQGIVRIIYGRNRSFPDSFTSEQYSLGNLQVYDVNSLS